MKELAAAATPASCLTTNYGAFICLIDGAGTNKSSVQIGLCPAPRTL
ncbi:hypothetical protein AVEN_257914-1, partial [Araneus ventricosus]